MANSFSVDQCRHRRQRAVAGVVDIESIAVHEREACSVIKQAVTCKEVQGDDN